MSPLSDLLTPSPFLLCKKRMDSRRCSQTSWSNITITLMTMKKINSFTPTSTSNMWVYNLTTSEKPQIQVLCLQQSFYFLVILWRNILDWGFWVYSSSSTAVSLTTVVKTMQIQKAVLVYTDSLAFRIPNEDQTMFVIIINCFSKWKKLYGSL